MPWSGQDWEDPALWQFPSLGCETLGGLAGAVENGTFDGGMVDQQANAEPMVQDTLFSAHRPRGPFPQGLLAPPAMNALAVADPWALSDPQPPVMNTLAAANPQPFGVDPSAFGGILSMNHLASDNTSAMNTPLRIFDPFAANISGPEIPLGGNLVSIKINPSNLVLTVFVTGSYAL